MSRPMWSRLPRSWPKRARSRPKRSPDRRVRTSFAFSAKCRRGRPVQTSLRSLRQLDRVWHDSELHDPRLRFLGRRSAPRAGRGAWDPSRRRNRRRRTSLLVERRNGVGVTRVLVDTSPDLREQLLDAEVDWLDAVLFTHEHADHTHGIDDLRGLFIHRRRPVDVYLDDFTSNALPAR